MKMSGGARGWRRISTFLSDACVTKAGLRLRHSHSGQDSLKSPLYSRFHRKESQKERIDENSRKPHAYRKQTRREDDR